MSDRDAVRTIDRGTPPARFARGWHCLGLADRVPRRRAARGAGVRHQAGGVRRLGGPPARARRVLPAHGRRPDAGHGQGRRGRLPVPRLALGRRRPVRAASPTPGGCRRAARTRSWLTLEQNGQLFVWNDPQGNPPRRARDDPADRGRVLRRVERLDLGHDPGRGRELPRGHRQRRRHGALLLHPLRVPDVLQERVRGAHRHAVPADQVAARTSRPARTTPTGGGDHAALRGLLLRAVLHDRLPVARLPRHRPSRAC